MASLTSLRARRKAIKDELDSISAQHPAALPDDVQTRWDSLLSEAGTLEQRMDRQAALDDLERRIAGTPLGGGAPGRPEVRAFQGGPTPLPQGFDGTVLRAQDGTRAPVLEARHRLADFVPQTESRAAAAELGLGGFLRALHSGPQSDLERRVLAESSLGSGGAMVPTPLAAEIIDLMRARSVSFRAGARTIPMTSQTLRFARITEYPEFAWRAENAPIVDDQPVFDSVTLTAKSDALLVRTSRELWEDAQNLDAQLRTVIANAAALSLDQAILFGTGTSNQPTGIANTTGVQSISMGTNGAGFLDWDPVLDAVGALEAANAGTISAMVLAPRTARRIYGLVDTSDQPLDMPPRIAGIPQLVTSAVPINQTQGSASNATTIILGDFSEVYVGMRTSLQISVLQERFADNGQIGFVCWMRADVAVARPAAMAKIIGIVE